MQKLDISKGEVMSDWGTQLLDTLRGWWDEFTSFEGSQKKYLDDPQTWEGIGNTVVTPDLQLKPLYFVNDIENNYVVADPQPPLYPEDWSGTNAKHLATNQLIERLQWLVSQLPIVNAPMGADSIKRAAHAITRYAYIHPDTFKEMTHGVYNQSEDVPFLLIYPSPTMWIRTDLMPLGGVLFANNAMPGMNL